MVWIGINKKNMKVTKRNGLQENLDFEKINKVVIWACEGIKNVNPSSVLVRAKIAMYDGISTAEIHNHLIRAASDMISESEPNYSFVASKLQNYLLYKEIYGNFTDIPTVEDHYNNLVNLGFYDKVLLDIMTPALWKKVEKKINHNNDFKIPYAGILQFISKYLVKNRITHKLYETPQMAYMLLSLTAFSHSYIKYGDKNWFENALDFYDAISSFKINLPTPIISGVRTTSRQFSSCTLIDAGDTIDSIFSSAFAMGKYISKKSGIGLNIGRLRSIGSKIRGGESEHTGKIPFLKMYEGVTKSCSQGGIRDGSTTVNVTLWDMEIEDILVLKNNKGTDSNRVRKIDYVIQISQIFYQRLIQNKDITLFSTDDTPGLYEAFGNNILFNELYLKYEQDPNVRKKTIKATYLFNLLIQERIGTGRIYISNIDNCNSHSSFKDNVIFMSNLCVEISLPTTPFESMEDLNGEIALCILGAINFGVITKDELERLMELQLEFLDNIIDIQDYPVKQSMKMLKRRSLGVGINNLAYFFAKNKVEYGSKESLELLDEWVSNFTYYGIKASVGLAAKRGACEYYNLTKYSEGILPIDTYNKNVDSIIEHQEYDLDWNLLRDELKKYGIRNSTIYAQMPAESSSLTSGATNGIEPPREFLTAKRSGNSIMRMVVPGIDKYKKYYKLAFDTNNTEINNIVSVIQKYFDQAISVNHYYDGTLENGISIHGALTDVLNFYKFGGKNLYYANTNDGKTDVQIEIEEQIEEEDNSMGCAGGACSI